MLSLAEVARLARGAAWIVAVQQGRAVDAGTAATAGRTALAAARTVVESLDFDGDGRLSLAELAQDRAGFGAATGTAQGQPLIGVQGAGAGLAALQAMLESAIAAR